MEIDDLVVLTGKARKQFYETQKLIECFEFQGQMRNKDFKAFVNEYVGFISAETGLGCIMDISTVAGETTAKVEFNGPLGWDFHYFDVKDLRRI